MKASQKGTLALVIALLELSFLPIFLSVAGSQIGGVQLLFYVFFVASLVSITISYFYDKKGLYSLFSRKRNIVIIGIAGLFNNAISQLLLTLGTLGTNPSIAGIVFRSWVLFAALLIPFVLRTRVSKAQFAVMIVGFLGLYLVVSNGTLLLPNSQQLPFYAELLGSAIGLTIAVLIMRSHNASTTASVALFNIFSFFFMFLTAAFFHISLNVNMTNQVLATVLFLGVVTYGIGTTLYYYAYKSMNPILVGNATLAVPFLTILLSALIVGTPIKTYYIVATALIVGSVILQERFSGKVLHRINKDKRLKDMPIFDVTSAFVNNSMIMQQMKADNRALAVKVNGTSLNMDQSRQMFEKRNCIVFTNDAPHQHVKPEEMAFINEIIAPKDDEKILVAIGNANKIEDAFCEFTDN